MFKLLFLSFLSFFGGPEDQEVTELHNEVFELFDTDMIQARSVATKAYELSIESGNTIGEAKSLYILAYCDDELNKLNKAVPEYLQSLERFGEIEGPESKRNQAEIYMNLGRIFRVHYKYEDAISFYNRSLEIAREYDEIELVTDILHNLSIAYKHKGDLVKAAEIQFEKLSILSEKDQREEVKSYNQIGLINIQLENFNEARTYFRHILDLERDKKNSKYRAMAYHNMGDTYMKEREFDKAKEHYLKSISEKKALGKTKDLFVSYMDLTELHLEIHDFESAEKYGLLAASLFPEVTKSVTNNKINHFLSQIYFAIDESEKAKTYVEKYVTQMETLYDQQKELASQGDQYKIELITSTYFAKIQEQEKINYYMVGVAGLVAFFILFLVYNRYRKVAAAKMLREHFSSISFNISNTSSSK